MGGAGSPVELRNRQVDARCFAIADEWRICQENCKDAAGLPRFRSTDCAALTADRVASFSLIRRSTCTTLWLIHACAGPHWKQVDLQQSTSVFERSKGTHAPNAIYSSRTCPMMASSLCDSAKFAEMEASTCCNKKLLLPAAFSSQAFWRCPWTLAQTSCAGTTVISSDMPSQPASFPAHSSFSTGQITNYYKAPGTDKL